MTNQASQTFTATAGQTKFNLTIPYLRAAHLNFAIDGVAQDQSDFSVSGTVLTWTGTALTGGESVFVYRITPVLHTERPVDWSAGGRITEALLDDSGLHLLYLLQEFSERAAVDLTRLSATDPLDASGRRLTDLATPTQPTDAVTKAYADALTLGSGGGLPAVGGGDNDSGLAVVAGVWAKQDKAAIQTLWEILTQAAADARYPQLAQDLGDLPDIGDARGNLELTHRAFGLISSNVVNHAIPGSSDLAMDPGGDWWEDAATKISLADVESQLRENLETRFQASVNRTSGTPNQDDFIGLLENGGVQRSMVEPGTVSGNWVEVTSGLKRSFTDDGLGGLTGTGLDAASSIDYETGQLTMRASGAENVKDGTVSATFKVNLIRFNAADQAAHRVTLRDGLWSCTVYVTFKEGANSSRTVKMALTDDVSSAATNVLSHLWRTDARPLDVKANESVGMSWAWTFRVGASDEPSYVSPRAVASVASSVGLDNFQMVFDRLGV